MASARGRTLRGGSDRYEVIERDGSASVEGETITFTKHRAEGYVRCVDENGNVVAAAPPPPPAPLTKQEEPLSIEAQEPAWTDPSQPKQDCEMRGGRRVCH